ncbi:AAA domain-containing protein [Paenibacillus sp. UNC496MF]|uniref:zeta toxin family protein n=1 Tax=Paenibacillus sp. UNC496MF TaxID=1502753 RepID=UPI0008E9F161|nr:zeta toxin family protein [Paenibacillus sp. UNC496MF]SFJ43045.1 AAA domain-containing protein [Paenibacillus sp. UNC496MF]
MKDRKPVIYLLSGPPGAGKSTTSRAIAERLERSALIDGDDVYHMVAGGNRAPWESPFHVGLMWRNIGALARNFAETGHDVVVNYVAFREDIALFRAALGETAGLAALKFALLVAEEGELRRRDAERPPELRMGERCGVVLRELLADHAGTAHALDTTTLTLGQAVEAILREDRFVVE